MSTPRAALSSPAGRAPAPRGQAARVVAPAPGRARHPEPPPPLRIVAPRVRRRRAGAAAGLVVIVLFALGLGLTAFQTKLAADQQRLDKLETNIRQAQDRYEKLRLQVALLEAPDHVVSAAEGQGMKAPATVAYLSPSAEDVATVDAALAGAADPATANPGAVTDWGNVKPYVGGAP